MKIGFSGNLKTGDTTGLEAERSGQWNINAGQDGKMHTVMFDRTNVDAGGGFLSSTWNVFVEATIVWSVNGNFVSRKVSVQHGQSISGTGENVKVTIKDRSLNPVGAPPQEYRVLCTGAAGTRPSNGSPPTLFPPIATPSLAPAGAVTIPIDPDAGAILFSAQYFDTGAPAAYVDGNLQIDFMLNATVLKSYDPHVDTGWVPIPPGATSVVITNNSDARTYRVSPVFGIDG